MSQRQEDLGVRARQPGQSSLFDQLVVGNPAGAAPSSASLFDQLINPGTPQAPRQAPQAAQATGPAEPPSILGEFPQGIARGIDNLVADLTATQAVGAMVFGGTDEAQRLFELSQQERDTAEAEHPATVRRVEDIRGASDFARWAAGLLGEQVPVIASIMVSGGTGGVLGRLLGRGAINAAQFARLGGVTGLVGSASVMETGSSAAEQFEAVGEVDPGLSIAAGVAKGSLEAIVPAWLGQRLGIGPDITVGVLNKVIQGYNKILPGRLAAAAGVGTSEFIINSLQEAVNLGVRDYVDENFDILGPEARSRLLNAAAAGTFVGSVVGGIAGPGAIDGMVDPLDPAIAVQPGLGAAPEPGLGAAPEPGLGAAPAPDPLETILFGSKPGEVSGQLTPTTTAEPTTGFDDLTIGPLQPLGPTHPGDLSPNLPVIPPSEPDLLPGTLVLDRTTGRVPEAIAMTAPGGGQLLQFAREGRVDEQLARLPDVRQGDLARLDQRRLAPDTVISASLEDLPTVLQEGDPRVQGEARFFAMQAVKRAIRLRDSEQVQEALKAYADALERGFRYTPEPGQGFVVLAPDAANLPLVREPFTPRERTEEGRQQVQAAPEDITPGALLELQTYKGKETPLTEWTRTLRRDAQFEKIELGVTDLVQALGSDRSYSSETLLQDLNETAAPGVTFHLTPDADTAAIARALNKLRRGEAGPAISRRQAVEAGLRATGSKDGLPLIRLTDPRGMGAFEPQLASPLRRSSRTPSPNEMDTRVLDTLLLVPDLRPTVNGTKRRYNPATHKPGTAVWVTQPGLAIPKETQTYMRRIVKLYNQLMPRFGLQDQKLLVYAEELTAEQSLSRFRVRQSGALGHYHPNKGDTQVIGISFDNIRNHIDHKPPAQLTQQQAFHAKVADTVAHEFGHFFAMTHVERTDAGLLGLVQSAFHRHLVRGNFGGLKEFESLRRGPSRFLIRPPEAGKLATSLENLEYHFSFDEWAADQFNRFLHSDSATLDALGGWFRQIARGIQRILKAVHQSFNTRAEPEFEAWVESFTDNPTKLMVASMQPAFEKGVSLNAEVLASYGNGETIPPPQAATWGIAQMMEKSGVPPKTAREVRAFADRQSWFTDLFFNIGQLARVNPHVRPLQRYVELSDQWYVSQMQWMSRANERTRSWVSLGEQKENLSRLLFEMDQMTYLSRKERAEGVVRQPTEAEVAAIAERLKIEEPTLKLYHEIRDDFQAFLTQVESVMIRDMRRTITSEAIQIVEEGRIKAEFALLRRRPYFPHMRFGDFSVVVKGTDGKTIHMESYTTRRQAQAASKELARTHPDTKIAVRKLPRTSHPFQGLPPALLKMIRSRLALTPEQARAMDDVIIEMAPSASFRHRLQRRANTPGFSHDALRAYAQYFFSGSKYLARIEHGPLMLEQIERLGAETSQLAEAGTITDVSRRDGMRKALMDHYEYIMNPKPDWAQLRSAAFMWYLGFNASSAALNLTQVPLVGMPYLGARFGDTAAMGALTRAVMNVQSLYRKGNVDRAVPTEFEKAIGRAVQEGIVDESMATELAAVAEGGYVSRFLTGTKAQQEFMRFAHYSSWMFQQAERLNRRVMFRAGWDLALQQPESAYLNELVTQNTLEYQALLRDGFSPAHARAYLAGRDVTRRTQYQYAPHMRPKFMQGRRGVIFTFFMFVQNTLFYAAHEPGRARFMAMMLLMAGMMGLPGAEDLAAIARLFGRHVLGKDFDVEREVRELVVGLTDGSIPPDLILRGIGRAGFGLPAVMDMAGLPKAEFDFSRRIGLGQIIPGVAQLGKPGVDFEEGLARATTDAAGASYGIGLNILKALQDSQLPVDDFKRWERAMPTALSNMAKALRFADEGRERSRTGATVVEFDMTNPDHMAEVIARGLGFQPTRLSRTWDRIMAQREVEAYWQTRRGMLMQRFDHSLVVQDMGARTAALKSIAKYNREVPFGGMRITQRDIIASRRSRIRARRLAEAGLPQARRMRPLAQDILRLHPESVEGVEDVQDVSRIR